MSINCEKGEQKVGEGEQHVGEGEQKVGDCEPNVGERTEVGTISFIIPYQMCHYFEVQK